MNETKRTERPWTPGPWVADLKHYPGGADCYVRHHVELPPDDMRPSIYLSGYDGAEVSANTRLCSAAPELFEALQIGLRAAESCACRASYNNDHEAEDSWDKKVAIIKAALAKALGGQP